MRFEAKNAYIKSLVGKCFKNVPYTIAERHQNYMCLQLLSPPGNNSTNFLYRGDEIWKRYGVFQSYCTIMYKHTIQSYYCCIVTRMPLDDATLTTESRDLIAQSYPTVNSLPR